MTRGIDPRFDPVEGTLVRGSRPCSPAACRMFAPAVGEVLISSERTNSSGRENWRVDSRTKGGPTEGQACSQAHAAGDDQRD
jgi:hypothetical protein